MSSDDARHDDPPQEPLVSRFARERDMAELIEHFVNELRQQVEAIGAAWDTEDLDRLRRLAHQLKGTAGGYGFPEITDAAGLLESSLLAEEAEYAIVQDRVEGLVDLCRRASAWPPDK